MEDDERGWRSNGVTAAMGLALLAVVSPAAPVAADEAEQPLVILLAFRDEQEDFDAVISNMQAHFADAPVRLEIRWVESMPAALPDQEELAGSISGASGAMAVLWCDVARGDKLYFFIATSPQGRILVRRLDGVGREGIADALAVIGRTAVDGLLEGGRLDVAVPRPEPASVPEDPQRAEVSADEAALAEPVPRRRPIVSFELAYAMSVLSSNDGVHHGLALALGAAPVRWLNLYLGYRVLQPIEASAPGVLLTLRRHPIHLGLGGAYTSSRWTVGGSVAAIFDILEVAPRTLYAGISVSPSDIAFKVSLEPALRVSVRLWERFSLFLDVGTEIHLTQTTYAVEDGPRLLTEQWRAQPRAWLGALLTIY